ncbi:MAG: methyltransferase domain-containing protein [Candidatus Asgardarchaeia archaeon]
MSLTEIVYDKIVCPVCMSKMRHFGDYYRGSLYCKRCNVYYPINDGIPSLIPKMDMNYWKTLRKISRFYDLYSRYHDVNYDNPSMWYMRSVEEGAILKNLRGNLALDLGCGTGRYTELLLSKGFDVISVDVSKEMLKITRKRVEGKGYEGKFFLLQCDVGFIPFKDRIFDVILGIFGAFNHTPYYSKGFKALNRLLKGDGVAIISVLNSLDVRTVFKNLMKKRLRVMMELDRGRDGYLLMKAGRKGAKLYTHFFGYDELKSCLKMYFSKVKIGSILSLVRPEFKKSDRKVRLLNKISYVMESLLRWHFPLDRLGTYLIAIAEGPNQKIS